MILNEISVRTHKTKEQTIRMMPATLLIIKIALFDRKTVSLLAKNAFNISVENIIQTIPTMNKTASIGRRFIVPDEMIVNHKTHKNGFIRFRKKPFDTSEIRRTS